VGLGASISPQDWLEALKEEKKRKSRRKSQGFLDNQQKFARRDRTLEKLEMVNKETLRR
jgi:hypothetical protein